MSTIREQILQAVKARLIGATPAGDHVFRSRVVPLERELSPAIVVRWTADNAREKLSRELLPRDLTLMVDVMTRGEEPDALADPVVQAAHAALFTDPTFGGLAANTVPADVIFEADDADAAAGVTTAIFTVRYLTRAADPSARN